LLLLVLMVVFQLVVTASQLLRALFTVLSAQLLLLLPLLRGLYSTQRLAPLPTLAQMLTPLPTALPMTLTS
jgi:hypothetical protein